MVECRRVASLPEISGEAAANAGNFNQQYITEFYLGSKQSRRCPHLGKSSKLHMGSLDRAKGIAKGAINIYVTEFTHCLPKQTEPHND
jgi:hypothetical protein